jgi:hypothetical protein
MPAHRSRQTASKKVFNNEPHEKARKFSVLSVLSVDKNRLWASAPAKILGIFMIVRHRPVISGTAFFWQGQKKKKLPKMQSRGTCYDWPWLLFSFVVSTASAT